MSYTEIYKLYKTKVTSFGELRNGHGSGMAIWDLGCQMAFNSNFQMKWFGNDDEHDTQWDNWKSDKVDMYQKMAILSTYDGAYVGKEDLKEYGEACIKAHQDILEKTRWDWSHWEDIGKLAIEMSEKKDSRLKGLCISCTSVSDPWGYRDIRNVDTWNIRKALSQLEES